MRMQTASIWPSFLGVVLAATAAHADTNHDEISLGAGARALRTPSANAVTGDNLSGGALGLARDLGHDLGVAPVPDLTLWAEAGLGTGSATGTMFQSVSTRIDALAFTGGLAARYRLHRLVTAGARVALGAQRVRLGLTSSGATAYDHGWGMLAAAAAGLDLFAHARPPFGVGVRLEIGYAFAQAVALTPHTDRPDDTLALAMSAASIGHLDLSGPTATVSVLGQF
jgi:hypothetical protein